MPSSHKNGGTENKNSKETPVLLFTSFVIRFMRFLFKPSLSLTMRLRVFLLASILFELAVAWNSEGHRIISRIASEFMARKTSRFIRDHLLGSGAFSRMQVSSTFAQASVWADTVVDELPWSAELHFTNTPYRDCSPFELERDCGTDGTGRCIVTAIANYTTRASDINLAVEERVEAIKFLSHFIADAHQPLHGGFAEDMGATRLILSSPEDSLHEVWDSYLIENLKESMTVDGEIAWYHAANNLVTLLSKDDAQRESFRLSSLDSYSSHSDMFETASWIMSETVTEHTCLSAYQNDLVDWITSRDTLSPEYMSSRTQVAKTQLMKAGIRLAQIMDAVASSYYSQEHRQTSQANDIESHNTFNVLALDFCLDIEEAVFELPVESDETVLIPESEEPEKTIQASASEASAASDDQQSSEEKKREKNRKKRLRQKVNKRKMFGVDIESLVLIKRGRKFYITYKQFVVSETFTPQKFIIVQARFEGRSSIPFFFDWDAFSTESAYPDALFHAVFRKIGGLDYSTDPQSLSSFSVAGKSNEELKAQPHTDESAKSFLEAFGFESVDFSRILMSDISDIIRPRPTNEQLRAQYGGRLPSESERIFDTFVSQGSDIVSLRFGNLYVVSRAAFLMDNTNDRWVFMRSVLINSRVSLTDSYWLYFDARILNDEITPEVFAEMDRLAGLGANRKLTRNVIKRGSRILDRLTLTCPSKNDNMTAKMQSGAAFKSIRIAYDCPPERDYIELVMRTPADEKELLRRIGLPPVPRLDPSSFSTK